ncbi:MAG: hypothetical protein KBT21_00640 [Treponema sp.]|nr:hypothetical protein [Candidatus Treponema merdequi]
MNKDINHSNENYGLKDEDLEQISGGTAQNNDAFLKKIDAFKNQKITSQSDDPNGYQISERMRVQIRYND